MSMAKEPEKRKRWLDTVKADCMQVRLHLRMNNVRYPKLAFGKILRKFLRKTQENLGITYDHRKAVLRNFRQQSCL